MVREGTGADVLGVAIGHIPGTALPGLTGNVAVAGHRDTLFRGLREIKTNDVIQFETLGGTYSYRVGSTEIVKPDDVKVLQAGSSPELTLITCYPFNFVGSAPDRFIVKAALVTQGEQPQQPPPVQQVSQAEPPKQKQKQEPPAEEKEKKIPFTITKDHSRQLAPGISLGVTATDVRDHRVDGWMWLMPGPQEPFGYGVPASAGSRVGVLRRPGRARSGNWRLPRSIRTPSPVSWWCQPELTAKL